MSTNSLRGLLARSIKVNEKWSFEHDYPNFYSVQMQMHGKLDFEFNTFIVHCLLICLFWWRFLCCHVAVWIFLWV